jgi:Holliday junction resolvase
MSINSKQKGSRGEREFVNYLNARGFCASRTQQYCGASSDSADVRVEELRQLHFEVKRTERLQIYDAIKQAERDAAFSSRTPVVIHKKNREGWLAIMRIEDFLWLTASLCDKTTGGSPDEGSKNENES